MATKSEPTSVRRHADRTVEEWRLTRKLGTLLGEAEDVSGWPTSICLHLRLRLYASFIVPVLTYMGTWGSDEIRARTTGHVPLRQIVGIHWPHRISNEALYYRCRCRLISEALLTVRWSFATRCSRPIDNYFVDSGITSFRGRPRTTLPTELSADLRHIGRKLRYSADVDALRRWTVTRVGA